MNLSLFPHQKRDFEQWKEIPGYEHYLVSTTGQIFSKRKDAVLKPWEHNGKQPYLVIGLCSNGKSKKYLVHRLVAEAFIPNPNNLPEVNHKDGNVHNNNVANLEWVTNAENTFHAYKTGLKKKGVICVSNGKETWTLRNLCEILGANYKKVHCRYRYLQWEINDAIGIKGGGYFVMGQAISASRKCVKDGGKSKPSSVLP